MENIKESVKALHAVSDQQEKVGRFCRVKYDEKFPPSNNPNSGWHCYEGFRVLTETQLEINYSYGGGDMEFDDSFIVDLNDL